MMPTDTKPPIQAIKQFHYRRTVLCFKKLRFYLPSAFVDFLGCNTGIWLSGDAIALIG